MEPKITHPPTPHTIEAHLAQTEGLHCAAFPVHFTTPHTAFYASGLATLLAAFVYSDPAADFTPRTV
jgi:hypothetical protein